MEIGCSCHLLTTYCVGMKKANEGRVSTPKFGINYLPLHMLLHLWQVKLIIVSNSLGFVLEIALRDPKYCYLYIFNKLWKSPRIT